MKKLLIIIVIVSSVGIVWSALRTHAGAITIPSGAGVAEVARLLEDEKIVSSRFVFRAAFSLLGKQFAHPGRIVFPADCSLRCVVNFVSSPVSRAVRVTIPEGSDLRDIAKILEKNGITTTEKLYAVTWRPAEVWPAADLRRPGVDFTKEFDFLKNVPSNVSYEGYLFPDTYEFTIDQDAANVVRTMLANFGRRMKEDDWGQILLSGEGCFSMREAIIMASILEKEVRGADDREKVAGILWRRLANGWPLQIDASVQYVTGKTGVFTTSADRKIDSPWNTYLYRGLPVGPISNPGLNAIAAVCDPDRSDYWFYLTAPDGRVYYAKTLEEHVENKKYLK